MTIHKGGLVTNTTPQSAIDNWGKPPYRSPSANRNRNTAKRLNAYVRGLVAAGAPCAWCRNPIDLALVGDHPGAVTTDHIVDRGDGGEDTPENVQPMHGVCNKAKNTLKVRGERA